MFLSSVLSLLCRGPKTSRGHQIPAQAIHHVEEEIKKLKVPGLRLFELQGKYCHIRHNGQPLCRFKYRGNLEEWDFAIYKYSTGRYAPSEAFFPQRGRIINCLKIALSAYNID